jgi:hypothetical protein
MHIVVKEFENEASSPNNAVKNSVALNAALRPRRSEPGFEIVIDSAEQSKDIQVPQPIAPNIIPANIDEETVPI